MSALGALTSAGRALVGGDDPAPVVEPLLPTAVDHVLLQADLTAVAPGPLETEVARGLALLADVESRGGATVYRFTTSSVRRALDTGWPASQVHAFLETHSRTPVPQPLTYLVDDSARRHGRLRVGGAGVYVRSDDPTELDTLLADASLAVLRLRRIAPTVALADAPADLVLTLLRAADRAPVLEDSEGRSAETEPPARRSATVSAPLTTVSRLGPGDAAAVVAAVRAGERARAARPTGEGAPVGPTRLVEELRTAVEDGRTVWLAYLDETGTVSERVVDPVGVDGGERASAFDQPRQRADAGLAALPEQSQHLLAGLGVERAGRLVGEHQHALPDHAAGDRHPLLLAAGHLVGEPVRQVGQSDLDQRGLGLPSRLAAAYAVELQRERHVLGGGE